MCRVRLWTPGSYHINNQQDIFWMQMQYFHLHCFDFSCMYLSLHVQLEPCLQILYCVILLKYNPNMTDDNKFTPYL